MQPPTRPISSWLVSSCIHVAALALLLAAAAVVGPPPILPPRTTTIELHPITAPPPRPPAKEDSGGGQGTPEPAAKGRLPEKPTRRIFLPPMVAINDQPRLVIAVGLINAPEIDSALSAIGDPFGILDSLGGGPGKGGGIGIGDGPGIGEGTEKGFTRATITTQKLTRRPEIISKVEPQYSEPARRAHLQGSVKIRIDVGLDGIPTNIRVVEPIGMGLDEAAIEAVKRWRFRPALVGDRPVVAPALVEVGFHLL